MAFVPVAQLYLNSVSFLKYAKVISLKFAPEMSVLTSQHCSSCYSIVWDAALSKQKSVPVISGASVKHLQSR